jgi:hypothetical protein
MEKAEVMDRFCQRLHQDVKIMKEKIEDLIDDFLQINEEDENKKFVIEMRSLIVNNETEEKFREALYAKGAISIPSDNIRQRIERYLESGDRSTRPPPPPPRTSPMTS